MTDALVHLHPFLTALASRLEESGVENPLVVAAAHARYWRKFRKTDSGERLSESDVKLIEAAVISLNGTAHDGERVDDETAGRIVADAEHRATVAEGLLSALASRDGEQRAEETARKLLDTDATGETLNGLLDEAAKMNRQIARALKRRKKKLEQSPEKKKEPVNHTPPEAPTFLTDERLGAQGQMVDGQFIVEAAPSVRGSTRTTPAPAPSAKPGATQTQGFETVHPRGRGGKWIAKGQGVNQQGGDPRVKEMQQRLAELGFKTTQDGQFGIVTEEAVKAFQRKYGLPESGKVDEATVETMRNPPAVSAQTANAQINSLSSMLTPQARQQLEQTLGKVGLDQSNIEASLKELQRQYGLHVNGMPDGPTMNLLARMQQRDKREAKQQGSISADQLQHAATTEEPEEGDMPDTIDEAVGFEPSKHPRARGGRFAQISFNRVLSGGKKEKVSGHDLGHGLAVVHRRNGVSGLPEHTVYHHETGMQVAAIGDKGDDHALVHEHMAFHFGSHDYKGMSVDDLRKDARLKEKAQTVSKVRQSLGKVEEASFSSGGFDTNAPVRQSYGGVLPGLVGGVATVGGLPAMQSASLLAEKEPGRDAVFGNTPVVYPPNLRESEDGSFARCGTCLHHNGKKLCALYSAGTDRDDLCDSWLTLSPPQQVLAAMYYAQHVGEFVQESTSVNAEKMKHARVLLEAAVEETGGDDLSKLVKKFTDKGMPVAAAKKAAAKALANRRSQEAVAVVARDNIEAVLLLVTPTLTEAEWAALDEAADSLAKASQHEEVGHTGKGLWGHKGLQLPAYIQHIANDIKEKRGLDTSRAVAIAIGAVKRWARGGGKVDAGTKAAAAKAVAEWEALKASHGGKKLREALLDPDEGEPETWCQVEGMPPLIERVAKYARYEQGRPLAEALQFAALVAGRLGAAGDREAAAAATEWAARDRRVEEALDKEPVEVSAAEAVRVLTAVKLHEAGYPVSLHFDPRLHPRGRTGQFTDVLAKLKTASHGTEVTLPHGVSVRRSRGGTGLTVSHGGKKLGTFTNTEKAAARAIAATGIPEPSREQHMMVRGQHHAVAFDPGDSKLKNEAVVSRALGGPATVRGKSMSAVPHASSPNTTVIHSYKEPLAVVDHSERTVHLDVHQYSATTSGHRTLVRREAAARGYSVHEVDRAEARTRAGLAPDEPFTKLPAGVKAAQRVAQDRHRRLHNEEVEADEKRLRDVMARRSAARAAVTGDPPPNSKRGRMAADERMIQRRVSGGNNEQQSRDLLKQLRDQHSLRTRPAALAYHGFITTGEAEAMSREMDAYMPGVKADPGSTNFDPGGFGKDAADRHELLHQHGYNEAAMGKPRSSQNHWYGRGYSQYLDEQMHAGEARARLREPEKWSHLTPTPPVARIMADLQRASGVKADPGSGVSDRLRSMDVSSLRTMRQGILDRNKGKYGHQVTGGEALDNIEAEFRRRGLTMSGVKADPGETWQQRAERLGPAGVPAHGVDPHAVAPDSRVRNILSYAESGSGRSYGGGMADYGDADIERALGHATTDKQRAALHREMLSRGATFPTTAANMRAADERTYEHLRGVSFDSGVKGGGETRYGTGTTARFSRPGSHNLPNRPDAPELLSQIKPGTRVTIMTPQGQERSGKAVMKSSDGGWVLNAGGAHGTPILVNERNIVRLGNKRKLREVAADVTAALPWLNSDTSMASLLKADEAVLARLPLAEVLLKHGAKIPTDLREELHDMLATVAPPEQVAAKLTEARERNEPLAIRLYETLVEAVGEG